MTAVLVPTQNLGGFFNGSTIAPLGCGCSSTYKNLSNTWRTAGTFSNLYVNITANSYNAATAATIYINSANGNETVSIGAHATGEFQDTTHTDVISSGATMAYSIPTTTSFSIDVGILCTNFAPMTTSDTITKYVCSGASFLSPDSYYLPPGGYNTTNYVGDENYAAFNMKTSGTNQNMYAYVSANSKTNTSTVQSRINYGSGNLLITIGASDTGTFEDTTHTDTVASGNTLDYGVTVGEPPSTSCEIDVVACEFLTTNGETHYISGIIEPPIVIEYNVTTYVPISGTGLDAQTTTESNAQVKSNLAFTASFLQAYVATNSVNGTTTVKMRVASASGNESLSISTNATGLFTDSTHTDDIASGDEVDYQFSTAGTSSGDLSSTNFGILASYPASTTFYPDVIWFGMTV